MTTPTSFSSLTSTLYNQSKSFHIGSINSITDRIIPFSKEQENALVNIIESHRHSMQIMKSIKGGPDSFRRQLSFISNLFIDDDHVHQSIRQKLENLLHDLRRFIGNTHSILNLNMLLSLPGTS